MRDDVVLVLNVGSSNIKFAIYYSDDDIDATHLVCGGKLERSGQDHRLQALDARGSVIADEHFPPQSDGEHAVAVLVRWIEQRLGHCRLCAAGHRVVHGGTLYSEPVKLDPAVISNLERFQPFAPLHQPPSLAAIRALAELHPNLPQVACFDTAFHATQKGPATLFALPRQLRDEGLRRYGFHGLSYEYIASVLPEYLGSKADGRVVVAHLGNGDSMCAMNNRKSVATSTGLTTIDGLPMATRTGSIDPGVVFYLATEKRMDIASIQDLFYRHCGLLGLSGISGDMRALLASTDARATLAIDYFVYRIVRELGALAACNGGIDALIFTGGIGENAAPIRERICEASAWLGIDLDGYANAMNGPLISSGDSRVDVLVIRTDEDLMIARHTREVYRRAPMSVAAATP